MDRYRIVERWPARQQDNEFHPSVQFPFPTQHKGAAFSRLDARRNEFAAAHHTEDLLDAEGFKVYGDDGSEIGCIMIKVETLTQEGN